MSYMQVAYDPFMEKIYFNIKSLSMSRENIPGSVEIGPMTAVTISVLMGGIFVLFLPLAGIAMFLATSVRYVSSKVWS